MNGLNGENFEKRIRRLQQLIHAIEAADSNVRRSDALEIVRSLLELHGAGLERLMKVVAQTGEADVTMRKLAGDDMIAGLLLLYDLHPDNDETRIRRALDKVRSYLHSHGGDVELIGIDDGAVRLRLKGSCQGCPSSAMTLKLAVEDAIYEAAPNVTTVLAEGLAEPSVAPNGNGAGSDDGIWEDVPGVDALTHGRVQAFEIKGRSILFCRIGDSYYAYGNICPGCNQSLQDGRLDSDRLVCSHCERQYDLVLAGRSLNEPDLQLEPFPLLVTAGHARIAIPEFREIDKSEGGL